MSLRNILNRMKGEIDELYAMFHLAGGSNLALDNRAYVSGGATVPASPTAGGSHIIIAAIPTVPKASGVYHLAVSIPYTGATAADTVDFRITSQTQAGAIPLTGGTPVGVSANAAMQVSTAAAGMAVTGGPFGSVVQYDTLAQVQATGGTTGLLEYSGICTNIAGSTPFTPFTVGFNVVFLLDLTFGAHTMTFNSAGISIELWEMPKATGR
jgi:hypothetical protein